MFFRAFQRGSINLPYAILLMGPWATIGTFGLFGAFGLWNDVGGIIESARAGKWAQALERGGFGILDALFSLAAIQGARSASANANCKQHRIRVGPSQSAEFPYQATSVCIRHPSPYGSA